MFCYPSTTRIVANMGGVNHCSMDRETPIPPLSNLPQTLVRLGHRVIELSETQQSRCKILWFSISRPLPLRTHHSSLGVNTHYHVHNSLVIIIMLFAVVFLYGEAERPSIVFTNITCNFKNTYQQNEMMICVHIISGIIISRFLMLKLIEISNG